MKELELTYLEFYSGIGGWSYALQEAISILQNPKNIKLSLRRLAAFDHSDLCNHVLNYNNDNNNNNHSSSGSSCDSTKKQLKVENPIDNLQSNKEAKKHQPMKKRKLLQSSVSIEKLTKTLLQDYHATVWVMSPPCQPHTRQHSNQEKDINDPRSKSFLHLCEMISCLGSEYLPRIILLENVLGFEQSKSCFIFRKALLDRKYRVNHFHLNPTQIGIPNDRPRHYTIAVLPSTEVYLNNHDIVQWYNNQEYMDSTVQKDVLVRQSIPNFIHDMEQSTILPLSNYLDQDNTSRDDLIVPEKLIHSDSSWCFDIVTVEDCRSSCFTSSYGRFIRGTGSVIYTGSKHFEKLKLLPPEERTFDSNWSKGLDLVGNLRYFSGIEIARLFGFPVDANVEGNSGFQFPPDCTEKQQWKLLGNSINVHVAAKMVYIGLSVMLAGVGG